jgi:hypothetical protein
MIKQIERLRSFLQREVESEYVMENIIRQGKQGAIKWNIHPVVFTLTNSEGESCGCLFKVNTPTYSDMLLVTLSYLDLFQVRFLNKDYEESMEMCDEVHVSELFETIDKKINKFHFDMVNLN